MQTPQKRTNESSRLFKMFSISGQNKVSTPINAILTESKVIAPKPPRQSVRTTDSMKSTKVMTFVVSSEENQEVEEELADFKKYLHKSSIMEREMQLKAGRPKSKGNSDRQTMKDRLQLKILQAQEKLEEIKSTLKKYQREKSEIVKNSDMRRSSIHSKIPTVRLDN